MPNHYGPPREPLPDEVCHFLVSGEMPAKALYGRWLTPYLLTEEQIHKLKRTHRAALALWAREHPEVRPRDTDEEE